MRRRISILIFQENLSGIKVTQIFGREEEKMAEFREKKPDAGKGKPESDFRVQCISSVGVYAFTSVPSYVCFIWAAWDI